MKLLQSKHALFRLPYLGDLMTEKKSLLHLLCTNVSTCAALLSRSHWAIVKRGKRKC